MEVSPNELMGILNKILTKRKFSVILKLNISIYQK